MTIPPLPYAPERCGSIYSHSKTDVFGYCYDYNSTLVALSVQAPATTIEQIHYSLQGQDQSLQLMTDARDGHNRTAFSRKLHFDVVKAAIPDSGAVSLIMVSETLRKPIADNTWTHVWHRDDEDFKRELFMRVRDITYTAVLEKWASFLYMRGMVTTPSYSNKPLCGIYSKRPNRGWMCAGFSIGYIRNDREEWEQLISKGLKEKAIAI